MSGMGSTLQLNNPTGWRFPVRVSTGIAPSSRHAVSVREVPGPDLVPPRGGRRTAGTAGPPIGFGAVDPGRLLQAQPVPGTT